MILPPTTMAVLALKQPQVAVIKAPLTRQAPVVQLIHLVVPAAHQALTQVAKVLKQTRLADNQELTLVPAKAVALSNKAVQEVIQAVKVVVAQVLKQMPAVANLHLMIMAVKAELPILLVVLAVLQVTKLVVKVQLLILLVVLRPTQHLPAQVVRQITQAVQAVLMGRVQELQAPAVLSNQLADNLIKVIKAAGEEYHRYKVVKVVTTHQPATMAVLALNQLRVVVNQEQVLVLVLVVLRILMQVLVALQAQTPEVQAVKNNYKAVNQEPVLVLVLVEQQIQPQVLAVHLLEIQAVQAVNNKILVELVQHLQVQVMADNHNYKVVQAAHLQADNQEVKALT